MALRRFVRSLKQISERARSCENIIEEEVLSTFGIDNCISSEQLLVLCQLATSRQKNISEDPETLLGVLRVVKNLSLGRNKSQQTQSHVSATILRHSLSSYPLGCM